MARHTKEEQTILKMLKDGLLDGFVGDDLITSGKSTVWKQIKNGVPQMLKQGPGSKFFDGKENTRIEGKLHILQEWVSDEEKLQFFQKFGWLMDNDVVKKYSAKFKPKK